MAPKGHTCGGNVRRERINADALELEERVVQINRVSKVVKGGRRFSFSTVVVVGDGKGHVGVGMGKASEVPEAIRKGTEAAKKNLIRVPLVGSTVPHDVQTKYAATKVMIRPAAPGTGVIAGRGVRPVVEAAGIKDVLSKVYGSNNPVNVVKAAFQALSELSSLSDMARRRDMTPQELIARRTRRESAPVKEETSA
ncbi:30S ribosomal protein S5 [Candidatus Chloroploca sp. M-50]|uniref:Small ribosomal subunit protein uS5 n=1 Tax=Candidatus Chloroploca mongolica TaxID=2528176 RepID=A0ABS4DDU7_9CHLR|nr:30S ribosomal protein S5 [Candidatus Chloroploca mongolica]